MRASVLIVGAGPAATSTALGLLRHGIAVSIVTTNTPTSGIPVDVLPPDVKPVFASLGVAGEAWTDVTVACHGIEASWGDALPVLYSFLCHPQGDGIIIERSALHRLLLQCAINAGAQRHAARFVSAERGSAGWRVTLQASETTEKVDCRVLVDASGRAAVVAQYMGAHLRRCDRLCCVAALLANCKQQRVLTVVSTAYGWWYATPTPDGRTLVCLLSDADLIGRIGATRPETWLALLRPIAPALSLIGDPAPRVNIAAYPCESAILDTMGAGWIAVGDASARFDPLAAIGVLHAIRTGRTASEAIACYLQGHDGALVDFARAERSAYAMYLRGRQSQYALERRFPQHTFWARRTHRRGSVLDSRILSSGMD
jgi:2-polyprenyl-6-methoxyphenol hydroxylase-like FAD-dependent oxidoreductase